MIDYLSNLTLIPLILTFPTIAFNRTSSIDFDFTIGDKGNLLSQT